jgi:hypothetical protein
MGMPRANRRRDQSYNQESFDRLLAGFLRTEIRRGREWNVQPVSEERAVKEYTCPGCSVRILPGVAHLVTWRADGVLGDEADLAARRHWHNRCWDLQ